MVDWTFKSDWFYSSENKYQLILKNSLDAVYKDLCVQISGKPKLQSRSLSSIVKTHQEIKAIMNEIERLRTQILKCNQFKVKVELNLTLKEKERELKLLHIA